MSSDPMVGQDEGTQQMVKEAKQNFPEAPLDDAVQRQAEAGPGREAAQGEGSGLVDQAKAAAAHVQEVMPGAAGATAGGEGGAAGGGSGGLLESAKEAASSAMDALKQANPATRDTREPHC